MNKDVIWVILVIEVAVIAILTMLHFSATQASLEQRMTGLVFENLNITSNDTGVAETQNESGKMPSRCRNNNTMHPTIYFCNS